VESLETIGVIEINSRIDSTPIIEAETLESSGILDDVFHGCAWAAFAEAVAVGKHNDSEYIKQLCYRYYEDEIRRKNNTIQ
jgi:hypothetical protein